MPTRRGEIIRYAVAVVFTVFNIVGAGSMNLPLFGPGIWMLLNLVVTVVAMIMMRWRRRYPVTIAVALNLAVIPFIGVSVLAVWAYLSLCTHRRWRATVLVGLLSVVTNTVGAMLATPLITADPPAGAKLGVWQWVEFAAYFLFSLMMTVAVAAIGSYLGARREARAALQERLAAMEREQALVEENSRVEERNRIAREMHDVLAHKISLISMHAGALAYRDDLSREEIRDAAQTIQDSSHQALNELRVILGQLRQTGDDASPAKPQPTLAELPQLVAEHRAAGRHISVEVQLDGQPGQAVGRHAYRVIQEALTNAAKHAPGTATQLTVAGGPQQGVHLRVANPLSYAAAATPGSGMGLIGLEERVELVGGHMSASPDGDGNFVVEVWMPW